MSAPRVDVQSRAAPGVTVPKLAGPAMSSVSWLLTVPPTSIGVESDAPLVATSGMRLVAESESDANCRVAIDVVTARRGLNRTNTVQLEAGLVPDAAAIGPVVQVRLVIVKSPRDPAAPEGPL